LGSGSGDRKHHSAGDTTAHEQRKNQSPHTAPELTIALGLEVKLRTMEPAAVFGAGFERAGVNHTCSLEVIPIFGAQGFVETSSVTHRNGCRATARGM
jgi:hypothetical protein